MAASYGWCYRKIAAFSASLKEKFDVQFSELSMKKGFFAGDITLNLKQSMENN